LSTKKRKKGPKRDAKGRFVSKGRKSSNQGGGKRGALGRSVSIPRDRFGRFVAKGAVRENYVREIEALRREVASLRERNKARERDIDRNYKRRGQAYDQFVSILSLNQRSKLDKYLDDVYDGKISKEDFVTMSVMAGLTVREAWAVLYS